MRTITVKTTKHLHSKIFGLVFSLGFIFVPVAVKADVDDLYLQIYEQNQTDIQKQTLQNLTVQTGLTEKDAQAVLNGIFNPGFEKLCKDYFKTDHLLQTQLYKCVAFIQQNHAYEKELVNLEQHLIQTSNAGEIWSDGDLSNSFFDLMVDFSIIETILFGESSYQYPFSSQGINLLSLLPEKETNSKTENSNTVENIGTNLKTQTSTGKCHDPEILTNLDESYWENLSEQTYNEGNNASTNYQTSNCQGSEFDFAENTSNSECNGTALYNGLMCQEAWPCDNFFCIKVRLIPQKIGSSSGKAISLQEIMEKGIAQLTHLKGYTLTVYRNSNERFMVSVNKFLSRLINLDVITQSVPVKFYPQTSSQFDDLNGNPEDGDDNDLLSTIIHSIAQAANCFPEENGDYTCDLVGEETINLRTTNQTTQTETFQKLLKDSQTRQVELEQLTKDLLTAEKIKFGQGEWEDLRTELNQFANYFASITEVLSKLIGEGDEILDDVKKSCNSKR